MSKSEGMENGGVQFGGAYKDVRQRWNEHMVCKIKQIQGYEDRFVDYSGITLNDRFFFFHVSKKRSEELEERTGFQAGILRYDVLTDTSEFVAYPSSVYFESYVPGKTSIHMAELQWEQMNATFILYKFDCNKMKSSEIYRLNFTDSIADSSDVSALWRIEINSLSDQYILLGIPDLDPFSDKDNHGFEKYLLLDIVNQVSYPVQESLGEHDSILNFARLQRFMYEETDYLVLHTGRMTSFIFLQRFDFKINRSLYYMVYPAHMVVILIVSKLI